jgi:hypothetical protein
MNRTLFAATAALLAIAVPTAATATAATKKKAPRKPVKHVRTITFSYTNPCGFTLNSSAIYGPGGSDCPPGYQITTSSTEKYMSVTVTDKTGQAVPVTFVEDASASTASWDVVCGKATNLSVSPSDTYDLNPVVSLGDTCPVPPTQGTVVVKLSNLP